MRSSSSRSSSGSSPYRISATRWRSPGPLGAIGFDPELVDPARDLLDAVERFLLLGPAGGELVAPFLGLGQLALDGLAHVLRLLRHRGELDLELAHAPVGLVELERRRVDLHAQARGGLVDEVDRLVGEEAVGDVTVGQDGRRDERGVADADAVVRFVAILEPAQDRDRVGDRRLPDHDRLEAPLERSVLLDVLSVLVERRGPDRAQLAAGEHRLQHVGGVDGAFGRSCADDRVQLVDEEDDLALGRLDLLEHGLEPLLELAAVLGAGEQRADVERPDPLALEPLGHVSGDDPLGKALDDRGLADAGLADQHRVVLRTPREHLDDPAHLLVAADDRVELALLGERREVAAELLERLVGALRVLRRDALRAAHLLQGVEQGITRNEVEREQQVLCRHELVLELAHLVLGAVEQLGQRGRGTGLLLDAADARLLRERSLGLGTKGGHGRAGTLDERARQLLVEQREHEVLGIDLRVAAAPRELVRACDGLLGLDRERLKVHVVRPFAARGAATSRRPRRARSRACTPCVPARPRL